MKIIEKLRKKSAERAMKDFQIVYGEPEYTMSENTAAELEAMMEAKKKQLRNITNNTR